MKTLNVANFCFLLLNFLLMHMVYGGPIGDGCTLVKDNTLLSCCKHVDGEDIMKKKEYENTLKDCEAKLISELKQSTGENDKQQIFECSTECIFNGTDMLTPEMQLNMELIRKNENMYEDDPNWKAVDEAAANACFDQSVEEGKKSAKCKSGSYQLIRCMLRYRYINCPKESWTESDECTRLKSTVEKCPDIVPGLMGTT